MYTEFEMLNDIGWLLVKYSLNEIKYSLIFEKMKIMINIYKT